MQVLVFLCLLSAGMSTLTSHDSTPALAEQSWLCKAQSLAVDVPLQVELQVLQAYTLLRQHPLAAVTGFYLVLAYLLYKASKLFSRSPAYHFKVIEEASSPELLAAIKAELEAFKHEISKQASQKPAVQKEAVTPEAVRQLTKEIQSLVKAHNEFQMEMLESHKDLWQTLDTLQLKAESHEVPEANGWLLQRALKGKPTASPNAPPAATPTIIEETDKSNFLGHSQHSSRRSSVNSRHFELESASKELYQPQSQESEKDQSLPQVESLPWPDQAENPSWQAQADSQPMSAQVDVQPSLALVESKPIQHESLPKIRSQLPEADVQAEVPKSRTVLPPVSVKSSFQRQREKLAHDPTKGEARAKFVPPPAARNPFGL
jgi:hypothetical protein